MENDVFKKAYPIIALMFLCGALIVGIAVWVGSENDIQDDLTKANETLPAPLTPEELKAYDVESTNKMNPVAVITTNKGVIEIELFDDAMPITAGNFAKLAKEGFYNGTKFHRVIDGFMIQGGDPNTKTNEVMKYGTGGPGYSIPDEFVKGEKLSNVRGTISMANSGPNTGGSQFFINLVDNKALDFDVQDMNNSAHPVFGQVVKGMEVVDAIGQAEVNMNDLPVEAIVIEKVEIREG
ncbi:MAG TPA: peptidylprolyl isomerase [Candidatus Paceibacterota bacterium]